MNKQKALDVNAANIAEFRASGGTINSFGAAPVLLLTTIGSKSGQSRTSPMMYLANDDDLDRVYVFASAAGAAANPAWFNNLVARPNDLIVEIGPERLTAHAEVLPESARRQIYAVQADLYPGFAGYQAKTTRHIPVVALTLERRPT
jgi:deazaflavin-dependent oxidoreductase (nitroreductase family)